MKIMKKVLAGALSLAVVIGACFAFTGCNSVKNKTYAYDSMTFTIVKTIDAEGKVTETQTLSFREYYIYADDFMGMGVGLGKGADYATYTMTQEEETAFAELKKNIDEMSSAIKVEFGKDTVDRIVETVDKISGEIERQVETAKYEIKDDKITVTSTESYNEFTLDATYSVETWHIVDDKIEMRQYATTSGSSSTPPATPTYSVGSLYYISVFLTEVK